MAYLELSKLSVRKYKGKTANKMGLIFGALLSKREKNKVCYNPPRICFSTKRLEPQYYCPTKKVLNRQCEVALKDCKQKNK